MISHAKRKRIQALHAQGKNHSEIAREVGVCRQTVAIHVRKKQTAKITKRFRVFKAITMKGGQPFFVPDIAVIADVSLHLANAECRFLWKKGHLTRRDKKYRVPDQTAFYNFFLDYKNSKKI